MNWTIFPKSLQIYQVCCISTYSINYLIFDDQSMLVCSMSFITFLTKARFDFLFNLGLLESAFPLQSHTTHPKWRIRPFVVCHTTVSFIKLHYHPSPSVSTISLGMVCIPQLPTDSAYRRCRNLPKQNLQLFGQRSNQGVFDKLQIPLARKPRCDWLGFQFERNRTNGVCNPIEIELCLWFWAGKCFSAIILG